MLGPSRLGPDFTVTRLGSLSRITRPQHPGLRPFLHERAAYVDDVGRPYAVRLVPTGHVTMVINLGPPFSSFDRTDGRQLGSGPTGSLVIGPEDRPGMCEHPGGQEAIRVQLTPLGAHRLFGVPLEELANTAVELRDVLGTDADRLSDRLASADGWRDRFDILDATLLTRIGRGPSITPQVAEAWRLITTSPGAGPIARITQEVGWSHKHLLRGFKRQVGLTPKALARVVRFQRAVALVGRPGVNLADVSARCGFYDQAHLNRDFRQLAGVSPKQCATARWAASRALAPALSGPGAIALGEVRPPGPNIVARA